MKGKLMIKIVTSFLCGVALTILFCKPKKFVEMRIDRQTYRLEIADTNAKRAKGLMLR